MTDENANLLTVDQYRDLTGDAVTPTHIIELRLAYIEQLCRNILQEELHAFDKRFRDKAK